MKSVATGRFGMSAFWVHLDERHLIEAHVAGKAWADDIADQLDALLGPQA